jgi:hypothetical protein
MHCQFGSRWDLDRWRQFFVIRGQCGRSGPDRKSTEQKTNVERTEEVLIFAILIADLVLGGTRTAKKEFSWRSSPSLVWRPRTESNGERR